MYDVIVVGDYCLDLIVTGLRSAPALGKEIYGTGCKLLPGGGFNTVVAMHRLGLRVGWASDYGSDDFSRQALLQARLEGLDGALFVKRKRSLRHITVAASYPHDRAFISYSDAAPLVPAGLLALVRKSARALFVPGLYYGPWFDLGVYLAKKKGMAIMMDGNSSKETFANSPALAKTLSRLDIFMPNRDEAMRLTGKNTVEDAAWSLSAVCKSIVIKDGANGAFRGKRWLFHPFPSFAH